MKCQLCQFHSSLNCGDFPIIGGGNNKSKIMILNLRATQEAHLVERPVGTRNELLLDKILKGAGLSINSVYVTNLVKCAGPITPVKAFNENAKICSSNHLMREIDIIKPQVIVAFGVSVPKSLFNDKKATVDSEYKFPNGTKMLVTHSLEELFRKGDSLTQEAIATIQKAKQCLSQ